jgi:amino acid transporter
VRDAVTPVPVVPSPKVHRYDAMVPSMSTLRLALKVTVKGKMPLVALAVATAVGALFTLPTMERGSWWC